jgi:hypothetical protein
LLEGTDDDRGGPQAENKQRIESEYMAEVVMTQPCCVVCWVSGLI